MHFLITFLEGVISFISPCILPLLPVYILYFAGNSSAAGDPAQRQARTLCNAIAFVVGFSLVFMLLGVFAGSLGLLLNRYHRLVNLFTGGIVVLFGLQYTGLLRIHLLEQSHRPVTRLIPNEFGSALLFGMVFAIGWSPCTGAFLGAAMMLAATQDSWLYGMLLLLAYSLGLGLPFVLCAVLIARVQGLLNWIKPTIVR